MVVGVEGGWDGMGWDDIRVTYTLSNSWMAVRNFSWMSQTLRKENGVSGRIGIWKRGVDGDVQESWLFWVRWRSS